MSSKGSDVVILYLYDMNDRVHGSLDVLVNVVRELRLSSDIPVKFYHPVIQIEGRAYDFNKAGINTRSHIDDGFDTCLAYKCNNALKFSQWLHSKRHYYMPKDYDMVLNNCIKFVEDVFEFLEAPVPSILLYNQHWLYQNRKSLLLKLVGKVSGYADEFRRSLSLNKKNNKSQKLPTNALLTY